MVNTSKVLDENMRKFLPIFERILEPNFSRYLVVRIEWFDGTCKLSLSNYIEQDLSTYALENVKTYKTPSQTKFYEELREQC